MKLRLFCNSYQMFRFCYKNSNLAVIYKVLYVLSQKMLLHSILSHLLVNSFYLLTAGSRKLELSISEEIKVLR